MSSSEDLVDAPPPDYNPRWARTRKLTSNFGQWLGVVDRDDGMECDYKNLRIIYRYCYCTQGLGKGLVLCHGPIILVITK